MNRTEVIDITLKVLEKVDGVVGFIDAHYDDSRFIVTVDYINGDTYTVKGYTDENSITINVDKP